MNWWWRGHRREDDETASHDAPRKEAAKSEAAAPGDHILNLQRSYGNRAVQRMMGAAGEPLGEEQRKQFEASFGQDLSDVRVHRDAEAEELASDAGADAFAAGREIYFARGKYSPETLAHEVGHTIQQQGASRIRGAEDSGLEHEAQSAGHAAAAGQRVALSKPAAVPAMQLQKTAGVEAPKLLLPSDSVTVDSFAIDSAELSKPHRDQLDALAKTLQDLPETAPDSFVTITGFADAPGTIEHNLAIGQQRADAVLKYLVAQGAPAAMLRASSLGESVLSVDTKKYDPRNRRVEINVFRRSFLADHLKLPGPALTLTPDRPTPPQKPIDFAHPHLPVHIPTKDEEIQEQERQNQQNADKAHEILKREAEEAERHPPGSSISDYFGKKGRELAKAFGLPKFLQDKAESLAQDLPAMGAKAIFDQIAADKGLDDSTKSAMHNIIDALAKEKVK